jgi:hypothetical protein
MYALMYAYSPLGCDGPVLPPESDRMTPMGATDDTTITFDTSTMQHARARACAMERYTVVREIPLVSPSRLLKHASVVCKGEARPAKRERRRMGRVHARV